MIDRKGYAVGVALAAPTVFFILGLEIQLADLNLGPEIH
jgi:hypothetical protein